MAKAERVLAGMDGTHAFYFGVLRQMRRKRWSTGRVVLTGDAGRPSRTEPIVAAQPEWAAFSTIADRSAWRQYLRPVGL